MLLICNLDIYCPPWQRTSDSVDLYHVTESYFFISILLTKYPEKIWKMIRTLQVVGCFDMAARKLPYADSFSRNFSRKLELGKTLIPPWLHLRSQPNLTWHWIIYILKSGEVLRRVAGCCANVWRSTIGTVGDLMTRVPKPGSQNV